MQYDTLYTLNLQNGILVWKIRVHNGGAASTITTESGAFNGKLVSNTTTVLNGKNFGKKNATTHFTQALKEADAKYAEKIAKGYRSLKMLGLNPDVTDTHLLLTKLDSNKRDASGELKPMLCQPFKANKIKYPRVAQAKVNGARSFVRLTTFNHGLFGDETKLAFTSKDGLLFNIPHLEEDADIIALIGLVATKLEIPIASVIIDTELYTADGKCTDIAGAARNANNPYNNQLFIVILDLAIADIPQHVRLKTISFISDSTKYGDNPLYPDFIRLSNYVYRLKTTIIRSDIDATNIRNRYIENGMEGAVLRDINATYKFGQRPSVIHKYKIRLSGEFRILDIIPQELRPELPQFVLQNDKDSQTFELIGSGSHESQTEYLLNKDKYCGLYATVEYYERSKTGLPFHCVFINIRNNE